MLVVCEVKLIILYFMNESNMEAVELKICECRGSFVGKKTGKEVKFYCIMIQLARRNGAEPI